MSILSSLQQTFGALAVSVNGSTYPYRQHVDYRIEPVELPPAALYSLLRLFSLNNGLYEELARSNVVLGRATAQIKSIRNPVPAALEFWGTKLWPDPLTIVTKNAAIIEPIETVWRWSNWRARRRTVARWCALYGEYFTKVQADPIRGRVWFEHLEPIYVTDFEEDPRGYMTMIRLDIPQVDEDRSGRTLWSHVEVWSSDEQTYRTWRIDGHTSANKPIWDLGQPVEELPLSTFGIDFVPFVRTPFSDVGEKRGVGAIQPAIEAIVEADISATNLHAMLYQDADGAWVLKSVGVDANGRRLPPPVVGAASADGQNGQQSDGSIQVGKRSFWTLPGNQELQSVVADINYEAALGILQDHDAHVRRLIPALIYTEIAESDSSELSGRAIRYKMTAAIDQVTDVRAIALEKLAQKDAMALTLGAVNGIPGFEGLGDFDQGAFEHEFEMVDIIPTSDLERAQDELANAQGFKTWREGGLPDIEALQRAGYSKAEALRIVRLMVAEAEAVMERQQQIEAGQSGDDDEEQE